MDSEKSHNIRQGHYFCHRHTQTHTDFLFVDLINFEL